MSKYKIQSAWSDGSRSEDFEEDKYVKAIQSALQRAEIRALRGFGSEVRIVNTETGDIELTIKTEFRKDGLAR